MMEARADRVLKVAAVCDVGLHACFRTGLAVWVLGTDDFPLKARGRAT